MKGIVITPECDVSVQEFGEPLYKTVGAVVGGYIEHVSLRGLKPYCMIVNEEGLLLGLPTNPAGCGLYRASRIAGTIVIMKDGVDDDGEPDIVGLSDEDILKVLQYLAAAIAK